MWHHRANAVNEPQLNSLRSPLRLNLYPTNHAAKLTADIFIDASVSHPRAQVSITTSAHTFVLITSTKAAPGLVVPGERTVGPAPGALVLISRLSHDGSTFDVRKPPRRSLRYGAVFELFPRGSKYCSACATDSESFDIPLDVASFKNQSGVLQARMPIVNYSEAEATINGQAVPPYVSSRLPESTTIDSVSYVDSFTDSGTVSSVVIADEHNRRYPTSFTLGNVFVRETMAGLDSQIVDSNIEANFPENGTLTTEGFTWSNDGELAPEFASVARSITRNTGNNEFRAGIAWATAASLLVAFLQEIKGNESRDTQIHKSEAPSGRADDETT